MPELLNFFHFYDKIAKRRGWPTTVINDNNNIFDSSNNSVEVVEQLLNEPMQREPEVQETQIVDSTENTANQLREYQQRRQQEFRQQQEIRQREQQRIQLELQQQRQVEFQQQFRNQFESRQQQEIQQQQELQESQIDQFDDEQHIIDDNGGFQPLPSEYVLEDAGVIQINKNESGFEPINGEVIIKEFIEEDPENNIVFKFCKRYYLVDKSRIHNMAALSLKDNSIFYGCTCEIEMDWTNPQTWNLLNHVVMLNPIYFNMQHLGLPIRYVNLNSVQSILYPHQKKHNYYVIEKPEDYVVIPSFASDNVLKHGIGSMSGLHCQSGQTDTIYTLKKFTPEFIE